MASATKPDLDEFLKLSRPSRKPCPIGVALEHLDTKTGAQLEGACASDPGIINTGAIVQWLQARGHKASIPAVTAHRRASCTCHVD